MKEILTYLILSLLTASTAYFGWQYHTKSDWVHPGTVDEQLDKQTRVYSAKIATERAIIDSLSVVSAKASKRIRAKQETIQTLTTLGGKVRIVRDTVEVVREVPVPADIDTTITFEQSFTDSLFIVTSELRFRDGAVSNRLHLEQLRDIRVDIALTNNKGLIMSYVSSDDFEISEYRTLQVEPKQERYYRAWWFAGGFATATLFFLIAN